MVASTAASHLDGQTMEIGRDHKGSLILVTQRISRGDDGQWDKLSALRLA